MPLLYKGRDWPYLFLGKCDKMIRKLFTSNIKGCALEIGVNLTPQTLVDFRVTCAPLKTMEFMSIQRGDDGVFIEKSAIWFGQSPSYVSVKKVDAIYRTFLDTTNGNSSGNELISIVRARLTYDLDTYPSGGGSLTTPDEGLRSTLHRTDGQVYILVLQAGRRYYRSHTPIDDPFNLAHSKGPIGGAYIPGYEATALGCVEQHDEQQYQS
jgi:hypothetical protein